MGPFIWSLVVLIACVGFGGFYLAKQFGYLGGLGIELLGLPAGRGARLRRRLTAVLLMVSGAALFVTVNWLLPWLSARKDLPTAVVVMAALLLLFLLLFVMGMMDLREIRNMGRRIREVGRTPASPLPPSDNGGSRHSGS